MTATEVENTQSSEIETEIQDACTKSYIYGIVCTKAVRPSNLDLVVDTLADCTRYYNALIRIENDRRAADRATLLAMFPEFKSAFDVWDAANAAVDAAYQAIKDYKRVNRTTKVPDDLLDAVDERKADRKVASAAEKAARKAGWADADMLAVAKTHSDIAIAASKAARKAAKLRWGSYQQIEEAVKAAKKMVPGGPLRFRRRERYSIGSVSVHFQDKTNPMTWARALAGRDNQLKIWKGEGGRHWWAKLWVASEGRGKPVYLEVPFVLHRPLPDGAVIKWAKVNRRKVVADKYRYELQLTIKYLPPAPKVAPGAVGVNLGWRLLPDGSLRVAYWVGSDGREDSLIIPASRVRKHCHPDELQSIRSMRFNAAVDELVSWLAAEERPESHRERFRTLPYWRSTEALRQAYFWWRTNRVPGDNEILEVLRVYAAKELHLAWWENCERQKCQRWRLDFYRNFAADMFSKYGWMVTTDADYAEMRKNPLPGEKREYGIKEYINVASVGFLGNALNQKYQVQLTEIAAQNTTAKCHLCGHINEGVGKKLLHVCEGCGVEWDIDRNNAINCLREANDDAE